MFRKKKKLDMLEDETVEHLWDKLADQFFNFRGVSPRKSWLKNGLAERSDRHRVRILETGREGRGFQKIASQCTLHELRYLMRRAEVNFEQAQAAARVIVVTNVTIMIGFLVLLNQIFPGVLKDYLADADRSDVLFFLGNMLGIFVMITIIVSYAHGGASQARDLKHLLQLEIAKRDFQAGAISTGEEADDSSVSNDLRDNFISDI